MANLETQSPENKIPLPKLRKDSSLENAPYSVDINLEAIGKMLQAMGVNEQQIAQTTFILTGKQDMVTGKLKGNALGVHNPVTHTITIYFDQFYTLYQKHIAKAEKISQEKLRPKSDQFKSLLTTKRLSDYLAEAPPERGMSFARQLLERAVARKINHTAAHESGHHIDFSTETFKAWFWAIVQTTSVVTVGQLPTIGLLALDAQPDVTFPTTTEILNSQEMWPNVTLFLIFYLFITLQSSMLAGQASYMLSRHEKVAEKFAKIIMNNPEWKNMITIEVK